MTGSTAAPGTTFLAGGHGADRFDGGAGTNTLYHEDGETMTNTGGGTDNGTVVDMSGRDPGRRITVGVGENREFRQWAESNVDALRSLPSGRDLLTSIDGSGRPVRIEQADDFARNTETPIGGTGEAGDRARRSVVGLAMGRSTLYGNGRAEDESNGASNLSHEFGHADDDLRGRSPQGQMPQTPPGGGIPTMVDNLERETVGLPYDHDQNPATPIQNAGNGVTENDIRRDLGMPRRTFY